MKCLRIIVALSLTLLAGSFLVACNGLNLDDGYYNNGRYNDGYYDDYGYRDNRYYDRRERDRLRQERREIENERRRLEEERRRHDRHHHDTRYPVRKPNRPTTHRPAPKPERCPPGFRPSERKCTNKERRKGCKDIRMPGGLGCVKR